MEEESVIMWADFAHYEKENIKLSAFEDKERIVFMGDSITESWSVLEPEFFNNKSYINRGISGQTTFQMLLRFRTDVINLKPKGVVILAGTNDIAGNSGPVPLDSIFDNIASMAELAGSNGIKVIIASILPVYDYPWTPGLEPAGKIIHLNDRLKKYAEEKGFFYLDYFSSTADGRNGMNPEYSEDGVHPNRNGYLVMGPLAEDAIKKL